MLARVLRAAGYEVLLAATPREAVSEAQHARPDLIVLDLRTPDPESWQAFEEIRRVVPSIPLIATTACSNQLEQAARRGIDTLLEKPLDLPLLLSFISQLLTETEQGREERKQKQKAELVRVAA